MAHVNLETGNIYGAEKGTLSYAHELGHLAFSKTNAGEMVRLREELSKDMLLVIFLGGFIFLQHFPNITKLTLIFFVARWLYYYNYEEFWCWKYAFWLRKIKRQNKLIERDGTKDV